MEVKKLSEGFKKFIEQNREELLEIIVKQYPFLDKEKKGNAG